MLAPTREADAVLRIRRHVLAPAAGALGRTAPPEGRGADRRRPAGDRHREHRLPRAPARGEPGARAPLDRARRRSTGGRARTDHRRDSTAMSWRSRQAESRRRYLTKFDAGEAQRYDALVGQLSPEDEAAYLADLTRVVELHAGAAVLDAGAGTGALTRLLARLPDCRSPRSSRHPRCWRDCAPGTSCRASPRRGLLRCRSGPQPVRCRRLRRRSSRGNSSMGLYDPLAAFRNWHHWLKPGGVVVVIEGLYGRSAWSGIWAEEWTSCRCPRARARPWFPICWSRAVSAWRPPA